MVGKWPEKIMRRAHASTTCSNLDKMSNCPFDRLSLKRVYVKVLRVEEVLNNFWWAPFGHVLD